MEQDALRKKLRNQSAKSLDNFVITKNKEQLIRIPEIDLFLRELFIVSDSAKKAKRPLVISVFQRFQKKLTVTPLLRRIVTF